MGLITNEITETFQWDTNQNVVRLVNFCKAILIVVKYLKEKSKQICMNDFHPVALTVDSNILDICCCLFFCRTAVSWEEQHLAFFVCTYTRKQ